jgi:hypothetical protein
MRILPNLSGVVFLFWFPNTVLYLSGAKADHDFLQAGRLFALFVNLSEHTPELVNVVIFFFRHAFGMPFLRHKVDTSSNLVVLWAGQVLPLFEEFGVR